MTLCCTLLTGCEAEEVFGKTGQYILKLGEDVFRTGHQGATGGEESTDPQSNDETHIFQNYDIKKVENAPKEEKVAYNFSGPANSGISSTNGTATPAETIKPQAPASNVQPGTTIVITAGHCVTQQNDYECPAKQCYAYLVQNLLNSVGLYNESSGVFSFRVAKQFDPIIKELYKVSTNKNLPTGADGRNKTIIFLKSIGALTGKTKYVCPAKKLGATKYYSKYGTKAEKLINYINKCRTKNGAVAKWIKPFTTSSNTKIRTSWNDTGILLKIRSMSGASYSNGTNPDDVEHTLNLDIAKALQKQLTAAGYNVVLGRNSDKSAKLTNGKYFSNRQLALLANSKKAAVHFVIHWDSTGGSTNRSGIHLETGGGKFSDSTVDKKSKAIADVMYKKNSKYFDSSNKGVTKTDQLTTLNWAEVPTIIVECGWLQKSGDNNYVKSFKEAGKTNTARANAWVKARLAIFKAGIEKASK